MSIPPESKTKTFQVTEPGVRLDIYLANEHSELSRSYLQKLISQGCVLVNGIAAKAKHKLNTGDRIDISLPPAEPASLTADPTPLTIIYEDDDLLVIDKPAGLVVHPVPGYSSHTLINAVLYHYPDLAGVGDPMRPGVVHRLDKNTSGLIVVAKNNAAQKYLTDQFKARTVVKGYLVLVSGKLSPMRGIIEAPVGRDPGNRKRMAVVSGGREARTSYRVEEYISNYSLLEIITETGRTHQIRVHLSAIGYPVVGDAVYGVRSRYFKRQFVHANHLGFNLFSTGVYREFTCELASDLKEGLKLIKDG